MNLFSRRRAEKRRAAELDAHAAEFDRRCAERRAEKERLRADDERIARIAQAVGREVARSLGHAQITIDPKGVARVVADGQRQLHHHGRKV